MINDPVLFRVGNIYDFSGRYNQNKYILNVERYNHAEIRQTSSKLWAVRLEVIQDVNKHKAHDLKVTNQWPVLRKKSCFITGLE